MKGFSKFFETEAVTAAKENMDRMELKITQRKYALKESQYPKSENMALRELRHEQSFQVPSASLAVHTIQ